jgi:hypothetical protein
MCPYGAARNFVAKQTPLAFDRRFRSEMTTMQDQANLPRFARQSNATLPTFRPDAIPDLARYLGVTPETLSQLAALHDLRQRRGGLKDRPSVAQAAAALTTKS